MIKLKQKFLLYFFCFNLVFVTGQSNTDDNTNPIIYLSGVAISFLGMTYPEIYNNINSAIGRNICFVFFLLSSSYCVSKFLKSICDSEEIDRV